VRNLSEIPLKPLTKSDVHKLESALMIATLLRPDVLEKIKNPTDRLTWIDSLAVAAAALARERAGYSVSRIAEDLGRTEATIRNHLAGKTEAGKLVKETFEKFIKEGVKIEIPTLGVSTEEFEKLRNELKAKDEKIAELEKQAKSLEEKINFVKAKIKEIEESL